MSHNYTYFNSFINLLTNTGTALFIKPKITHNRQQNYTITEVTSTVVVIESYLTCEPKSLTSSSKYQKKKQKTDQV